MTHVHLHYQLQVGPTFLSEEGLPCSFARYRLPSGSTSKIVTNAPADTGDILEHPADDE
ncbi:MAG: hypothetical protein GY711_26135 [bacterium]|nr:hypothetical protein [bacterium]